MKPDHVLSLLLVFSTGCASSNNLLAPRFDDDSGNMIVAYEDALVLARPVPHLSTSARDYVYLGPVEVTRNGVPRYYLWVGVTSTVDRSFTGEPPLRPVKLSLKLDGETLDLPLDAWEYDSGGFPYATVTPVLASLRAPVSFDDLERLQDEHLEGVTLHAEDGLTADFDRWRGRWPEWQLMAQDAGMGFIVDAQ